MNHRIFLFLFFITITASAQNSGNLNVRLKSGGTDSYIFASVNGLTFSGVQGSDTLKVKMNSGLWIPYFVPLIERIDFSNTQPGDSISIELKGGTKRKYAVSSISGMSFIGWDKNTSAESLRPESGNITVLGQNYPNPFNTTTTIPYFLPKQQNVTISVSTLTGRKIVSLAQGQQSPGGHQVIWDASSIPAGIYFYRLQSGEFTETKKMILLK